MKIRYTFLSVYITLSLLSGLNLRGQSGPAQVDIIFDASGSMWGQIDGTPKIVIAKKAMNELIENLSTNKNLLIALRIYGHLDKTCTNSVLEIPMSIPDVQMFQNTIKKINPKGKTPISYSLLQAKNDFKNEMNGDKTIILITDGLESCNGDPCKTAEELKKAGIATKLHIVGFGMKSAEVNTLKCITQPFNGQVFEANDTQGLTQAFEKITTSMVNYNLQITAANDDGENILVDYFVYSAGDHSRILAKGDNSLGKKALVTLEPGNVDIKVSNKGTGDEILFKNNEIKRDQILKKQVIFAQRELVVKIKDSSGKFLYGDVYIYDTAGEELKYADTSMGSKATFTLLPNIYHIKVMDSNTRKEAWLKNVDLTKEKIVKKEILIQ